MRGMSREPFRRYTRRDPTSAADQNRLRRAVEDRARDRPADNGGLHAIGRAGAQVLVSDVPLPIWISIDGAGVTSSRYEAWTEQQDQGDGSFVPPGDALTGSAVLPAFLPPGWPVPAVGDVVLSLPSADGSSLLLLTPSASAGTSLHPISQTFGPYLTQTFVGPNVSIDFTDIGVVVNLGEVYFQAERVSWAADQDDLALDPKVTFLNVEPTASGVTLTGIAGGANGRLLYVVNRDALQDLTLVHDSASSAAGNRLQLPTGADVVLLQNEGIALYYSETDACWFALDEAAGGSTPPAFSGARVYHSANQTFSGSPPFATAIAFDSERYDTDAYHDTVTANTRLTIPSDGYYQVGATVYLSYNAASTVAHETYLSIRLNNTTYIVVSGGPTVIDPSGTSWITQLVIVTDYHFTAGDYVELFAHTRDSTVLVNKVGNYSPEFWIHKLG